MTSSYDEVCFGSKADLAPPTSYVCLVPKADFQSGAAPRGISRYGAPHSEVPMVPERR